MAATNFASLLSNEKDVWSRDLWRVARNNSFAMRFTGSGSNAMITRITELTKTERGTKAIFMLLADLEGDGVVGDYELEGNEEAMRAFDIEINIDQLRHANKNTGRLADQKTVINFRENSRDVLGYWLADRIDQLCFLTLSGLAYTLKTNGAARPVKATGQNLGDLEFASDVTAPSAGRHLRWDSDGSGGGTLEPGDTAEVVADDTLTFRALVLAQAYAKDNLMRGIRAGGGEELFHVFVTPTGMAQLRLDPDFLANVRNAGVRGDANSLFAGVSSVLLDGMVVHQYRHVFDTRGAPTETSGGAADGEKWGDGGTVDGQRVLLCGAQALGMCDLGAPYWDEETYDYNNAYGISVGKMFGLKKPVFHSDITDDDEDYGVLVIDTAI